MDVATATRKFKIRLYRWALQEWEQELRTDFRLLRKVGGNASTKMVEILGALGHEERHQLVTAMTKRFHKEAVSYLGDRLTQAEEDLLREIDSMRLTSAAHRDPSSMDGSLRKRLANHLRHHLSFLGSVQSLGGLQWRYATSHGTWRIGTYLDAGGKFGDCSYCHSIETVDGLPIARYLSILAWLGVSSESKWRIATEDEAIQASADMAEICQHFLAAASGLLDRIGVDS